jgi:hypothetical protein
MESHYTTALKMGSYSRIKEPEMYEFAIEAVKRIFETEELTLLMSGHVRSNLQIVGIPFTTIYLEAYEKLKSQNTSIIPFINQFP